MGETSSTQPLFTRVVAFVSDGSHTMIKSFKIVWVWYWHWHYFICSFVTPCTRPRVNVPRSLDLWLHYRLLLLVCLKFAFYANVYWFVVNQHVDILVVYWQYMYLYFPRENVYQYMFIQGLKCQITSYWTTNFSCLDLSIIPLFTPSHFPFTFFMNEHFDRMT